MATISKRQRVDGSFSYTAQIRIKQKGEVVYTESETFTKKGLAKAWADRREGELRQPGVLEKQLHIGVTVSQVLRWYKEDFDGATKFGRSKLSNIDFLIGHEELSELDALHLTSGQLFEYAKSRRAGGAGPSTLNNDFIWLRNAFRAVRIGRNVPVSLGPIDDAAYLCRKEKMIAKSKKRDRRPELSELDKLLEHFAGMRKASIPMQDVILFALFSSRRQDEITRIRWADVDEDKRRVLVRDMKHPQNKIDTWVFVPDRAWEVMQRQPKDQECIFPYNGRSISASFTRACKMQGIEDLRFHDLRHECASWLFEQGLDIPRVAGVTGHKSWASLQRYTHLSEQGVFDRYKAWCL